MKTKGMIPFHDEQVPHSCKQSKSSHKQDEAETSDSQNTSVNIMRRTSSFQSIKSSFSNKSQTEYTTNSIEFDGEIELQKFKQALYQVASFLSYSVELVGPRRMLLIKNKDTIWKSICSCCFGITGKSNKTSTISVEFKINVLNSKKSLIIKLVEGSFSIFKQFQLGLQQRLHHLEPKQGLSTLSSGISSTSEKFSRQKIVDHQTVSNIHENPFNMERKSYLEVQKRLKKNYTQSILKLKQPIRSMKQRVIAKTMNQSQPINQILRTVNKIYEQIYPDFTAFNFDVIYYSIEKFVCQQCLSVVKQIYQQKYKQQQQIFQAKRHTILTQWANIDVIKYLQIKPQFQLIPEGANYSYIPYSLAIKKLSSLHFNLSLREKMRVIQEYYSALKVSCYDFHRGKQQIATMDDILPVIIYTVLKSQVRNFYAQLKIVDDYARACGRFEGDQRILTNLFVGLEYVSKQWVLD